MSKSSTASVEELYLKEKKKSNILMASTVILAVLFVWSLVNGTGTTNTETTETQSAQAGQQFQGRGPGGGRQAITGFFDETGAVDQEAIDALADRITQGGGPGGGDPSQFLERFQLQIDAAVESGEITEAQAAELEAAFSQLETSVI